jgi:surfeit locus 1 family protein
MMTTQTKRASPIRLIGAAAFGIAGVAVLVGLGLWQLGRLDEKLALIARIEARIGADPVPLPPAPDPEADRYRPVTVAGRFTGEVAHVLSARPGAGPGSRVIAVLEAEDGRRLMIDRGFLPEALRPALTVSGEALLTGTLDWPRDADAYTPAPDLGRNLWFSRAAAPLAAHLRAEPLLIVARRVEGAEAPGLVPQPVSIDIRNDHLEYAITWFLLALVWAAMSLYLLRRLWRDPA